MKTISIRLEDSIYEELSDMLDEMGQTKQTFFETFARTALRERSIPFIIKAPTADVSVENKNKIGAFERLEKILKLKILLQKILLIFGNYKQKMTYNRFCYYEKCG